MASSSTTTSRRSAPQSMLSSDQRGIAGSAVAIVSIETLIAKGVPRKQDTPNMLNRLLFQRESNLPTVVVNHEHHRDVVIVDVDFIFCRSGNVIFPHRGAGAIDVDIGLGATADGDFLDLT